MQIRQLFMDHVPPRTLDFIAHPGDALNGLLARMERRAFVRPTAGDSRAASRRGHALTVVRRAAMTSNLRRPPARNNGF
jgi:hypothetical protein